MSAPEAKNPVTAGISPAGDVDVGLLFERLRAELRRGVPKGDARGAEFASVRELEERLVRVERRGPAQGVARAATVAAQPGADAVPDYFAYESRMRGSTESV